MPRYEARTRIEEIYTSVKILEEDVREIKENHLKHIYTELKKISGRPSWVVTMTISFLMTLCGILLARIVQ